MPTLSEDRDAIRDLYARYCHVVDLGSAEEWADMFTDDAEFIATGIKVVGRDALVALGTTFSKGAIHHMTLNLAIEVAGDGATCDSSVLIVASSAVMSSGRSADELRRVDGSWRIARREFTADAPASA